MPKRTRNYTESELKAIKWHRREDKLRVARKDTAIRIKQEFLKEYLKLCRKHKCCISGNLVTVARCLTKKRLNELLSNSYGCDDAYAMPWNDLHYNEYKW